jgi:hypothetical protein
MTPTKPAITRQIASIQVGRKEQLRVTVAIINRTPTVEIRSCSLLNEATGIYLPTAKGVQAPVSEIVRLIEALKIAVENSGPVTAPRA